AAIYLESINDGLQLVYALCEDADKGNIESKTVITKTANDNIMLRVEVNPGGLCTFSYSFDGDQFIKAGDVFTAAPGKWKGAKAGIFCAGKEKTNDTGYADFDWYRVNPLKP